MRGRTAKKPPCYRAKPQSLAWHCDLSRFPRSSTRALEWAEVFLLSAKAGLADHMREPNNERHLDSAASLVWYASAFAAHAIVLARGGKPAPDDVDVAAAAKFARTGAERGVVDVARSNTRRLDTDRLLGKGDRGARIVQQQLQRTGRAIDALLGREPRPPGWWASSLEPRQGSATGDPADGRPTTKGGGQPRPKERG